jgi:hypothetical protein
VPPPRPGRSPHRLPNSTSSPAGTSTCRTTPRRWSGSSWPGCGG